MKNVDQIIDAEARPALGDYLIPTAWKIGAHAHFVDFDTDARETVATMHIVRNDDPDATAPYTIRITGNPADFDFEWED